ncbi:MAG: hypothetical protein F4086_19250 [Gemmatimonadetes bacterium]|nr:hypothetical protein [Acidimicrobiia bacterium]MYE73388.1 hypothetical protein [Acidimicrobiia bacterium]MYJ12444.1 hypothetical protein [Gemmatimonadota bacterium]
MTATSPPNPSVEPTQEIVNSALERIADAKDHYEFEQAWVEGLRSLSASNGGDSRALLLAEAGKRLSVFDEMADDVVRRNWLRHLVEEVRLRGDASLVGELAAVATNELREAFARAHSEIAELRAAVAAGESLQEFAVQCPIATDRVRDLGRIAEGLSGSGLTALGPAEDQEIARELANALIPPIPLVPLVPQSLRVSRDDLLGWANAGGSEQALPRLVRSLIAETEPSAEWLDMPGGTAVNSPGWDGIVRCARGNRYVPAGQSVWELSTKQNGSHKKAGDDYEKRVAETPPDERSDMSYVAVVCAPWTKAREFKQDRTTRGDFRQVGALNVDNLEEWLECAPATTVWMRDQMGAPVEGIGLLSSWWSKWLESTRTPLDEGFVLAGREQAAEDLRDRCRQGRGVVTVGGRVQRDEILAFLSAALVAGGTSDSPFGDVLYVEAHDDARRLFAGEALSGNARDTQAASPLTVVVPSAEFAEHLPAGSSHLMIVPVPGNTQAEIVLNAVDSGLVAQRFQDNRVELHVAHQLGGLARMSLMALRRHLSADPALHTPEWAKGQIDKTLRRSLLLGGWNESRKGDREVVERFTGHPADAVAEALRQFDLGDAPMTTTSELVHAVSPADTWMLLRDQLSSSDNSDFGEIAHEVLTGADPLRELSSEEVLSAQIKGVQAKYSSQLKQGVATTLALAGSKPAAGGAAASSSGMAEGIIRRLLRSAMDDATPRTWTAISDSLPLLAEAAPEAVLEALRTCLAESHVFARAMFTDGDSDWLGFNSSSPHFRILNALEVMAWSPEHLLATSDVLARLAEIDPGSRYTNRPDESLASIMCPWLPNTSADAANRLAAVRMLRKSHTNVAWTLMLSMLPEPHGVQHPSEMPRYRDWRPAQPVITQREYVYTTTAIANMLVEDAGEDSERWASLIGRFADLPDGPRHKANSAISRLAAANPDEAFKSRIWPLLRDLVGRHRRHSEANWALAETELEALEQVQDFLCPAAPAISYGDLFSSGLLYLDGVEAAGGYEEFQAALRPKQAEAIEAVFADGGLEAVFGFAESVDEPRRVGSALASYNSALDKDILRSMETASGAVAEVALGYFDHRFTELQWEGLEELLSENQVSPQVAADVLRSPPPVELPWTRVDAWGEEVATEYWSRVGYYDLGIPQELSQLLEVCRRLRKAGRLELAGKLLSIRSTTHESESDFADEAVEWLEQWIKQPSTEAEDIDMTYWRLASLLKVLDMHRDHIGTSRVAVLEWQCHPLLHHDPDFSAPNLYRELACDPELFSQLVEWAFKPATATPDERPPVTEAQQQMALSAYRLLRSWPASQFVPGLDDDGALDGDSLQVWIDSARGLLAASDRSTIGDEMIGAALAASPEDPDGEWPGLAVRNLLERLQCDSIERGLLMAIHNQRGVTSRSLTAGGDQERHLAESYKEQSRRFQEWPRTAAIFRQLARGYEYEAGLHDREAETIRRGLPT